MVSKRVAERVSAESVRAAFALTVASVGSEDGGPDEALRFWIGKAWNVARPSFVSWLLASRIAAKAPAVLKTVDARQLAPALHLAAFSLPFRLVSSFPDHAGLSRGLSRPGDQVPVEFARMYAHTGGEDTVGEEPFEQLVVNASFDDEVPGFHFNAYLFRAIGDFLFGGVDPADPSWATDSAMLGVHIGSCFDQYLDEISDDSN